MSKKEAKELDYLGFRGDRDVWLQFTQEVRIKKKKVWTVLKPFLIQYLKKSKKK